MARKAAVEEESAVETVKDPTLCDCGCGGETRGGRYLPGHDAKHRSNLLQAHDLGDAGATEDLFRHGFYTAETLAARADKGGDAESRKAARVEAKVTRIDAKIAALMDEREALLVTALREEEAS
jgi:hypothetical protein